MREPDKFNAAIWRKKPKQTRSLNTTKVILEAAEEVFSQVGFHNARSEIIAARAGVGVASIYDYFPNKTAIAMALMEKTVFEVLDDTRKAFVKYGLDKSELSQSLPLVIASIFNDYKKHRNVLIDLVADVPELRSTQLFSIDRLMQQASMIYLRLYIDESDSQTFVSAHAFISMVFTASIRQYLTDMPDTITEEEFIAQLSEVVLNYLLGMGSDS